MVKRVNFVQSRTVVNSRNCNFSLHSSFPVSGYCSFLCCILASRRFPSAVHPSWSAEVFYTTDIVSLPLPCHQVRFLCGSDWTTRLSGDVGQQDPAASPRCSASVQPHVIVCLGLGEHLWTALDIQKSSGAFLWGTSLPLDKRGRRSPNWFSPNFWGSCHLAKGGLESRTID